MKNLFGRKRNGEHEEIVKLWHAGHLYDDVDRRRMQNKEVEQIKISFVAVLASHGFLLSYAAHSRICVRSRYNCHAHSKRKETDRYIPDSDIDWIRTRIFYMRP